MVACTIASRRRRATPTFGLTGVSSSGPWAIRRTDRRAARPVRVVLVYWLVDQLSSQRNRVEPRRSRADRPCAGGPPLPGWPAAGYTGAHDAPRRPHRARPHPERGGTVLH